MSAAKKVDRFLSKSVSLSKHGQFGYFPFSAANPAQHPQGARRIRKAAKPPTAAQRIAAESEETSCPTKKPRHKAGIRVKQEVSELVEVGGVEPPSESTLTGLSPGAVRFQNALPAKTPDRLCGLVES